MKNRRLSLLQIKKLKLIPASLHLVTEMITQSKSSRKTWAKLSGKEVDQER